MCLFPKYEQLQLTSLTVGILAMKLFETQCRATTIFNLSIFLDFMGKAE